MSIPINSMQICIPDTTLIPSHILEKDNTIWYLTTYTNKLFSPLIKPQFNVDAYRSTTPEHNLKIMSQRIVIKQRFHAVVKCIPKVSDWQNEKMYSNDFMLLLKDLLIQKWILLPDCIKQILRYLYITWRNVTRKFLFIWYINVSICPQTTFYSLS